MPATGSTCTGLAGVSIGSTQMTGLLSAGGALTNVTLVQLTNAWVAGLQPSFVTELELTGSGSMGIKLMGTETAGMQSLGTPVAGVRARGSTSSPDGVTAGSGSARCFNSIT